MAKYTQAEKENWDKLYQYIKKDILFYEDNIKLPKTLIMRILGLKEGKFMANKKIKPLANYTFEQILMTFKINKFEIVNAMSRISFKDEKHKINYLMAIIESKLNDTCERMANAKKSEEKGLAIEINNNDNKAEYKKKTKDIKNSRLRDLL